MMVSAVAAAAASREREESEGGSEEGMDDVGWSEGGAGRLRGSLGSKDRWVWSDGSSGRPKESSRLLEVE